MYTNKEYVDVQVNVAEIQLGQSGCVPKGSSGPPNTHVPRFSLWIGVCRKLEHFKEMQQTVAVTVKHGL
jgi:hypothetical protein